MGGNWWREVYLSDRIAALPDADRAHAAAVAVAGEYVKRITDAAGCVAYSVPIRRRPLDKELFWLTLFCPRPLALWPFNEAVSLALKDWRQFLADIELSEAEREEASVPGLFSRVPELLKIIDADERQTNRDAIDDIKTAITASLRSQSALSTRHDLGKIFGDALGIGREMHLRSAWKELAAEGNVAPPPKGSLNNVLICPS